MWARRGMTRRRRVLVVGGVVLVAWAGLAFAAAPAGATDLCVASRPGCSATLQAAVDAAKDGDTIHIDPGTFAGGVTVDVSVQIVGAGASATLIRGGGPVLTIGVEFASSEPTVSISGVTITGGVNTSVPDHAVTRGGGVLIPQAGEFPFRIGATVTISDSVITGNTVASQQLLPPGLCGPIDCSFASGGGIFNEGALTLINTRVSGNHAGAPGSVTVFAGGGGISTSFRGTLTLRHSFVTGNAVTGTPPYGLEASGGGIQSSGMLSIEDSVVNGNGVDLTSTGVSDADHAAIGGGIHIEESPASVATIRRTQVSGNHVTVDSAVGVAVAVAGGIDVDGTLLLEQSSVDHNDSTATISPSSHALALSGGAIDVDGALTIRQSVIASNTGTSNAPNGTAMAGGGGVANFANTTLEQTLVIGNHLVANGADGSADGGGIWNGDPGDGRTPSLALTDSAIIANTLSGSTGVTLRGGGLFTEFPATVALTRTIIVRNRPDQCFGC